VVRHEREALMVPRGDMRALADGLVRLLDDESLRVRLGSIGRELAQSYAWPSVTELVLDVYADVLGLVAAPAA